MHKIASNKEEAVTAFSRDDLSKDLKDLDLVKERFPIQRSLGLSLDLTTVSSHLEKRQLKNLTDVVAFFSVFNSLYDPLGLVAPLTCRDGEL